MSIVTEPSTQGWRERAEAALAQKRQQMQDLHAQNAAELTLLVREVLSVNIEGMPVEGEGDTITLDGVTFKMLGDPALEGRHLVMVRPCETCGKLTVSRYLKTELDVGEVLVEWVPQCRECRVVAPVDDTQEL